MTTADTTIDLTRFAGTWALDSERTSVRFRTRAMWIFPVKGTAKALGGKAEITPDGAVTGTLVIDAGSLDTRNKRRDDHLRSKDFLEVAKYPVIVFEAISGCPVAAGLVEISGVLTVHGQTQPMTLQAQVSGSGTSATVSTEVEIDRSLWGMSWGVRVGAGLKNQLTIRAHFDRALTRACPVDHGPGREARF